MDDLFIRFAKSFFVGVLIGLLFVLFFAVGSVLFINHADKEDAISESDLSEISNGIILANESLKQVSTDLGRAIYDRKI